MPLAGGSSGTESQGFTHGFFQEGVKSTQFKPSKRMMGRLLPAFDMSIKDKTSDEFLKSYVPYRSAEGPKDFLTKTEGYTSWYYQVMGYVFLGATKKAFLSRLSYEKDPRSARGIDPIHDCRTTAMMSQNPEWKALCKQAEGEMGAALPKFRYFGLMNSYLMTDEQTQECQNQVVILTSTAMDHLRDSLARRAGRGDPVISAEWEDYLLGDVTHPAEGLTFNVRETAGASNANIKFAGLHFSNRTDRLEGHQPWPLDPATPDGERILMARQNIADDENVIRIDSYEEILDWAVGDGFLPYDLIEQACSPHVKVPAKPARNVSANGLKPSGQSTPASTPPAGTSAPNPPTAPEGTDASTKYWIQDTMSGAVELHEVSEIQAMLDLGCSGDMPVMAENQDGGWKTAQAFGLAPTPPVPSGPPTGPTTPSGAPTPPVGPPSPPSASTGPQGPPAGSPASSELSEEEETRFEELNARFSTDPNSIGALELPEYFILCSRKGIQPQKA